MADMSFNETRADLGCCESTLRTLVRENRIPHYRLGDRVQFEPNALSAWKAAGGTDAPRRAAAQAAVPKTRVRPAGGTRPSGTPGTEGIGSSASWCPPARSATRGETS